ncbi:hypothetical protein V1511DRAFT_495218 [Dipodascopsis uninucleata]
MVTKRVKKSKTSLVNGTSKRQKKADNLVEFNDYNDEEKGQSGAKRPEVKQQKAVKDGHDSDNSFDGREVFVPKTKRAKSTIPYVRERLHPDTMAFLRDLKQNNEREWFWAHENDYRAAKDDFDSFVDALSNAISQNIDQTVPILPVRDLTYRIHRDVRFTNDKTPYRTSFSAAFSRTGRSGYYAHYYVHIEPDGDCRVGAGMWHLADCNPEGLLAIRQTIDKGARRLKEIISSPSLVSVYFPNAEPAATGKGEEDDPIQSFVQMNSEDALKKSPKAFAKDHPEIALLRLRSFVLRTSVPDELFASDAPVSPVQVILELLRPAQPFVSWSFH